MSKLGFSETIFLQNYDYNKALRQSQPGSGNDKDDCRGMCVKVSRWAPLKYSAIMVVPETNLVLLEIEQIVFHIINAFSKEWQIKCGSN